jgi:uncharacterized protein YecT (DUF1311 family)
MTICTKMRIRSLLVGVTLIAGQILTQGAAAQTQAAMGGSSATHYEKANRELVVVYGNLMAKITREGQASLQASEAIWTRFRDQECDFEALGSKGGSINGMVVSDCKSRLTRVRIAELNRQLNCQEGDTSCGNQ